MPLDPRTPVLVGVAQALQRVDDPSEASEPLDLMIAAVRAAGEDAKAPALAGRADTVCAVRGVWGYGDPAREVARAVGASGASTLGTPFGGNVVQACVNRLAADIRDGERDVVVLTGAEWGRTQARARREGRKPARREAPGRPDGVLGNDEPMVGPAEQARGLVRPVEFYPVFESALRHARGEGVEENRRRIAGLWARLSRIAADNPHAWIREPVDAETLLATGPSNPMVAFPYSRLLCANNRVDMGAALLLCSLEAAQRAGVPGDRMVFPHAGTDAHDALVPGERGELSTSPAIRVAGRRALELAGVGADEIEHVDLYSCFPSAVRIAAEELGLSLERPLSVTGGLTFGGGPLNNYAMHAIARMVEVLRADPGSRGLVTANGGHLAKHAFGVYASEPPAGGFRDARPQHEVDRHPRRRAVPDFEGTAVLEGLTVMFEGDRPEVMNAACRLDDGGRTWARSRDPELMATALREELCGHRVRLDGRGGLLPVD